MKGRSIRYSEAELAFVEARATLPRKQAHAAFVAAFGRADVSFQAFCGLCKRQGWLTGRDGCFQPGDIPPNKGVKGFHAPGCEKGWFKPGVRRGRAAELHKPIGHERRTKDGYIERKIHDGMPLQSRWRAVHLIEWEKINGPIPEGYALKCLDGDKTNTAPPNWAAIPRAMLPRLNGRFGRGYDQAAPELRPTIMATTRLEHAAREARTKKGTER